ncbi:MAG TPA: hypothetical protein PLI47_04790, partial [Bacteroidia bacterium]|nr:hypothetical protein [Bacteroidia bacterium]
NECQFVINTTPAGSHVGSKTKFNRPTPAGSHVGRKSEIQIAPTPEGSHVPWLIFSFMFFYFNPNFTFGIELQILRSILRSAS